MRVRTFSFTALCLSSALWFLPISAYADRVARPGFSQAQIDSQLAQILLNSDYQPRTTRTTVMAEFFERITPYVKEQIDRISGFFERIVERFAPSTGIQLSERALQILTWTCIAIAIAAILFGLIVLLRPYFKTFRFQRSRAVAEKSARFAAHRPTFALDDLLALPPYEALVRFHHQSRESILLERREGRGITDRSLRLSADTNSVFSQLARLFELIVYKDDAGTRSTLEHSVREIISKEKSRS